MRKITDIIIHCSDSDVELKHTIDDIDEWHRVRGFKRSCMRGVNNKHKHIGYHYVIESDGTLRIGRDEQEVGAHCRDFGKNNVSIGICLVGKKKFNLSQIITIQKLLQKLRIKYPKAAISGHYQWAAKKTCPNFHVVILADGSLDTSKIGVV